MKSLNKKIAIIIAFRNFRDEEYFIPREIFEKAGYEVKTISDKSGIAVGAGGGDVKVDITIDELKPKDFDALILVGGPGAYKYIDDENIHRIIREFFEQKKILGAICIAPLIFARSGILRQKKATVWSSILDKKSIKILVQEGVFYEEKNVVLDDKIVTANGPDAAIEFAKKLVNLLKNP